MKPPFKNFFNTNDIYTITLNPDDKHQYLGKGKDRMKLFRDLINSIFISYPQYKIDYYYMIELSEPRNSTNGVGPRLHIHGILKFKSNKGLKYFLLELYYRLTRIGHIDIDVCNDFSVWGDYIHKQHIVLREKPISNKDLWTQYDPLGGERENSETE